jgi:hypothetical protein
MGGSSSAHGHAVRGAGTGSVGKRCHSRPSRRDDSKRLRGQVRTYYESPAFYEIDGEPGLFAAIKICGDDDGPRFKFIAGDEVLLELPIPAGEAMLMGHGLNRSAKACAHAAERLTEPDVLMPGRLTSMGGLAPAEPPAVHQHVEHHAQPPAVAPPSSMGPYGRREIGPGGYPALEEPEPRGAVYVPELSSRRHAPVTPPREIPAGSAQGPEPAEPPINHTRPLAVCQSGSRLRRTG